MRHWNEVLLTWVRSDNTVWKFICSSELPRIPLITAVFGVVFYQNKIMLTKNKRGRELLGGHIEQGESIRDALIRELSEEGWVKESSIIYQQLFGYRKITSQEPVANRQGGWYPFPDSYIPHFICILDRIPGMFHGHEVEDAAFFSIDEVEQSQDITNDTKVIIHYALGLV